MNYLEIAGALIGLLYLWFEYRASIWLWPVSVIMPLWEIINPLINMIVMVLVFGKMFGYGIAGGFPL